MSAQTIFARRARPTTVVLLIIAVAASMAHTSPVRPAPPTETPTCRPAGPLIRLPSLQEGSGVGVSRQNSRRVWAHNDSGKPVLVAMDDQGAVAGQIQLTGAHVEDWEAMAVGPCPAGSCLFVGDIGDNDAQRKRITIYRVPEPASGSEAVTAHDAFHANYPDGAHDAETLLVTPKGELYVVTKGDTGPVAVYRFPRDLQNGATVKLERVGQPRDRGRAGADDRITDGAISPDGTWVALRTNRDLRWYRAADLLSGNWREASRVNLTALGEPQGEGVTFADNETLYLVGEGGGKSRPGTFARLMCIY